MPSRLFAAGIAVFACVAPILSAASAQEYFATGAGTSPPSLLTINPAPINNPAADTTATDTQNSAALLDLGGGKMVSVWNDSGSFDGAIGGNNDHVLGYGTSTNNGTTWVDRGKLRNTPLGDRAYPSLANDTANGNVYLATRTFGGSVYLFKSVDSGQVFGAPTNATPGYPAAGVGITLHSLAVDNFAGTGRGNVYACWDRRQGADREIRFTRSVNQGAVFTPDLGVLISAGGAGCNVVVDPSHRIFLFYIRGTVSGGTLGDLKIYMRISLDRGLTFEPEVLVADPATPFAGGLRAVVNPVAARPFLYLVYSDDSNLSSDTETNDIFLVRSMNSGRTWSAAARVNDDRTFGQYGPALAFASDGEDLVLSYTSESHSHNDPMSHRRAQLGKLNAVGVPVFNQSFQISPDTPPIFFQDPNVDFLGSGISYLTSIDGAAGSTSSLSVTWADNRLANAVHATQPDVRFARFLLPAPDSDLSVSLSAAPASINLGKNTTITVAVTATGGQARDVFLSFPTVLGLPILSISPATLCGVIRNLGSCSLGVVNPGTPRVVRLTFAAVYAEATRTFKVSATSSGKDVNLANNAASQNVVVSRGGAVVHTFSALNVPKFYDETHPAEFPFQLVGPGKVVQVTAQFRLDHAHLSDTAIEVISPSGKVVSVARQQGNSGPGSYGSGPNSCSGTRVVFTDLATRPITSDPPFTGSFRPQNPFSATFLEPAAGTWKLRITDVDSPDGGTIGCLRLIVTRAP